MQPQHDGFAPRGTPLNLGPKSPPIRDCFEDWRRRLWEGAPANGSEIVGLHH